MDRSKRLAGFPCSRRCFQGDWFRLIAGAPESRLSGRPVQSDSAANLGRRLRALCGQPLFEEAVVQICASKSIC